MSFPKAKLKRFNEIGAATVPPVGAYDPKLLDVSMSGSFLKSDRFKPNQDLATSSVKSLENISSTDCSNSSFKMPQRTRSFSNAVEQHGKLKECENEIRRLLRERSNLLKDLTFKEEEIKKLDNKLKSVIRERTSLKASLVTLEKENKQLGRTADILKAKFSALDVVDGGKKDRSGEIVAFTEQLVTKDHQIDDLRSELFDVRRELENGFMTLSEKNDEIEQLKSAMDIVVLQVESEHQATKAELEESNWLRDKGSEAIQEQLGEIVEKLQISEAVNIELKDERAKLVEELISCQKELQLIQDESAKEADQLRKENLVLLDRIEAQTSKRQLQERFLSVELDNAYQKLASTEDCTRALQDYKDVLIARVSSLKETIADLEGQQTIDMHTIKSLKIEVAELSSQLANEKKAVLVSNSEITALKEQIHELQNIRSEASEKLKELESELYGNNVREETLQGELLVTRLALQVAESNTAEFRKCLAELQVDLDCEKEEVSKQKTLLEENKGEVAIRENELKDLVDQLREKIAAREAEITELTSDFNNQLKKQMTDIEALNLEAGRKDLEVKEYCDQLAREIEEKEDKIKESNVALEKRKIDIDKMDQEATLKEVEFKDRVEQLKKDIKTRDVQIAALTLKTDSLLLSTYSLKVRLQEEEKGCSKLREKLNAKEREMLAINEKIVEIHSNRENLGNSLTAIRAAFEDYKIAITSSMKIAMDEVSTLNVAAEIKEKEVLTIKETNAKLERELENREIVERQISEEKTELSTSLESKIQNVVDLERTITVLKEEAENLVHSFQAKELDLQTVKRSLQDKLQAKDTELVAALTKLQESRMASENAMATLQNNLKLVEFDKYNNEMLYYEMKNMRNILHDELRLAQSELTATEANLESSKSQTSSLLGTVDSLKSANAKKAEEVKALLERVTTLERENLANIKDVQSLEALLEKKRSDTEALNVEVGRLVTCMQDKDDEISQLRVVIEQNKQLANDTSLIEDLTTTMTELNKLLETSKEQQTLIHEMNEEKNLLDTTLQQQRQEIQRHLATIEWHSDREKDLLRDFDVLEEKSRNEQQELKKTFAEKLKAFTKMEIEFQRERKENEGRQNKEMVQSLTNDDETKLKLAMAECQEMACWRKRCEELQAKVEPFMEQLNAYEVEKNVMLSQNQETMSDLVKLSERYASLLGHQNHRQKIHHMVKLKEEILSLKEENTKLRKEVLTYKKNAPRRDGVAASVSRPCDSAKRSQHLNKENNGTPLRDRNFVQ